jgi:integrase
MPQVTALPADAFYQRLDAVAGAGDADTAAALLGAVPVPPLMASDLPKQCAQILRATLAQKSPRQRHKWDKERAMIMKLFLRETGGDRPLAELNRIHATAFRDYWTERVAQGEVAIETCNRNIGRLSGMLGTVIRHHRLPLENIFEDIRIRGAAPKQRIAYDPGFIQTRLLATGALDGLNDEARGVLYLMAETGVRISEACNLNQRTIVLDHRIPHIRILPDQRQLKTAHSERDIPLVGVALKVMRAPPEGFPRYFDKADVLSTTVNKFLRENELVPNGESLYSLRHSFEDRLTSVEAPDKVNATLMGHKWHRPKYGKGPTLDQKLEWLLRIAFTPPLRV